VTGQRRPTSDVLIEMVAAAIWWAIRQATGVLVAIVALFALPSPWGTTVAVVAIGGWIYWRWVRHYLAHRKLCQVHGVDRAGTMRRIKQTWGVTMRGCGLAQPLESHADGLFGRRVKVEDADDPATWLVPALLTLDSDPLGVAVEVEILIGQETATFASRKVAIAHAWGVREVRVSGAPHEPVRLVAVLFTPLDESRDVAPPIEGWNF